MQENLLQIYAHGFLIELGFCQTKQEKKKEHIDLQGGVSGHSCAIATLIALIFIALWVFSGRLNANLFV